MFGVLRSSLKWLGVCQKLQCGQPCASFGALSKLCFITHDWNPRHFSTKRNLQFGICFDIDGVLVHGMQALEPALSAMKLLTDDHGHLLVPSLFVTNHMWSPVEKAKDLSEWLGIQVAADQVITSQVPFRVFNDFCAKHCLLVGQGDLASVAEELGLQHYCTMEDLLKAYPLLDVVDHATKVRVGRAQELQDSDFPAVEAVFLLGEPVRWEAPLQVIVDLMLTNGKPTSPALLQEPSHHLPIIVCNLDLQFRHRAKIPRFGHGAFLLCLEALYKKTTGVDLTYCALGGKPSEITMRYSEHCLTNEAIRMGLSGPIKTLYMIGDNAEVDIVGANLYKQFIKSDPQAQCSIPKSRLMPPCVDLHPQSVLDVVSVLVLTGVYAQNQAREGDKQSTHHHRHRDIPKDAELSLPTLETDDVLGAVEYILDRENVQFK